MNYTEEKLQEIFRSASGLDPTYKAFVHVIRQIIKESNIAAIQPDLTNESRAYNCGRAASVTDLLYYIQELSSENDLTEENATNTDV